jgi:hypothetical protein
MRTTTLAVLALALALLGLHASAQRLSVFIDDDGSVFSAATHRVAQFYSSFTIKPRSDTNRGFSEGEAAWGSFSNKMMTTGWFVRIESAPMTL